MTFTNRTSTAGRYIKDLAERVFFTFAQAFGATLVAGGWFEVDAITDLSIVQKAGVAGIAAVLAVIKGVIAKAVSNRESASLAPGV
jgi:hypothetical protein